MFDALTNAPQTKPTAMARNVKIFSLSSARPSSGLNGSSLKPSVIFSSSLKAFSESSVLYLASY